MKNTKLSYAQINIIDYLKSKRMTVAQEWFSPSVIGMEVGHKLYYSSSAWASPKCRRLVDKGLLERNEHGQYRLKEAK